MSFLKLKFSSLIRDEDKIFTLYNISFINIELDNIASFIFYPNYGDLNV